MSNRQNIFILYMPPGNAEAIIHYKETIQDKVDQSRVFKYLDFNERSILKNIFGNKRLAVWGSHDSGANRSKFEKMSQGDDVMIVMGDTIKFLGKVAYKTVNTDLSRELWKNLSGESSGGWDLVYFIANSLEINVKWEKFCTLFNYSPNYQLRGFTSVSKEKLEEFYDKYDDLYSILERIRNGEKVEETIDKDELERYELQDLKELAEEVKDVGDISDHIKMQWALVRLGLKTGAKVWVPKNDQKKIFDNYSYNKFEENFTTGIDTPSDYVQNIDVIWKDQFRIDAAFEIENSTSIYSGLLRFSDLKIIAPNSNYPLYIVAPLEKRNKVIKQVHRPTFEKLGFDNKVRYLSYETINEIERFFESTSQGFTPEVIYSKSEVL